MTQIVTYTWQILNFITRDEVNDDGVTLSDAVVNIHWKRSGVAGDGSTASINGYTSLGASSVVEADFVSFNDLTEDVVTGWLDTANANLIGTYNAKIQAKIDKNSETTRAIPWS
tara:strand:- start:433 stop:774 length:342 start_codon:yes stop_codon:yes gene_type:complete